MGALMLLLACNRMHLGDPPGPIAVGARYDLWSTDIDSECTIDFSFAPCDTYGVDFTEVTPEPGGAFEVDPAGPSSVRAVRAGTSTVGARGMYASTEVEGEQELEAAEAAQIWLTVPGDFVFEELLVAPASTGAVHHHRLGFPRGSTRAHGRRQRLGGPGGLPGEPVILLLLACTQASGTLTVEGERLEATSCSNAAPRRGPLLQLPLKVAVGAQIPSCCPR